MRFKNKQMWVFSYVSYKNKNEKTFGGKFGNEK